MKKAFAKALKQARKSRSLTQEDFSTVSSRTYLSALERGLKSPTLEKMAILSATLDIHVISLLTLAYLHQEPDRDVQNLLDRVANEVDSIMRDECS